MNSGNPSLIEEPELLTEVPPILKRLAKTIAYAFYEPELIALVCILTKYPCIDEDSLLDRLQFDKRQLRQGLAKLKADKLIKQRTVKEKQADTGNFNVYNFYFINYKLFVNVVKYKLDHVRKKLESEEQQARNRPSFQCEICMSNFSDLEYDRLLDIKTGDLMCSHCGGAVVEDASHVNNYSNGSSLGRFNEQMEPIFKLLKACENINLAPDVLEPTPPSTAELRASQKSGGGSSGRSKWAADGKVTNLYDQSMNIVMGEEALKREVKHAKALPVWMSQSTVFHNDESNDSGSVTSVDSSAATSVSTPVVASPAKVGSHENEIMSDLLAYENPSKRSRLEAPATPADQTGASDGTADSDVDSVTEDIQVPAVSEYGVADVRLVRNDVGPEQSVEGMVKVRGKYVRLSEVTEDMQSSMTEDEHEEYLKAYHKAYEDFY